MTGAGSPARSGRNPGLRGRSAARMAAVQTLYQIDMSGSPVETALNYRETEKPGAGKPAVDEEFLADLVRGATARRDEIDPALSGVLTQSWPLERLEVVLRAILRAGTYELLARPDIDAPVVIDEYMRIAKAFFDGGEPKLVNGVLDRLAAILRSSGTGDTAPEEHDAGEER